MSNVLPPLMTADAVRRLFAMSPVAVRTLADTVLDHHDDATFAAIAASGIATQHEEIAWAVATTLLRQERRTECVAWLRGVPPPQVTQLLANILNDTTWTPQVVDLELLRAAGADATAPTSIAVDSLRELTAVGLAVHRRFSPAHLQALAPTAPLPLTKVGVYSNVDRQPTPPRDVNLVELASCSLAARADPAGRVSQALHALLQDGEPTVQEAFARELARLLREMHAMPYARPPRHIEDAAIALLSSRVIVERLRAQGTPLGQLRFTLPHGGIRPDGSERGFHDVAGHLVHYLAGMDEPLTDVALRHLIAQQPGWLEARARVAAWVVDQQTVTEVTPLVCAAAAGLRHNVQALVSLGADVTFGNHLAQRAAATPAVRDFLLAAGAAQAVEQALVASTSIAP